MSKFQSGIGELLWCLTLDGFADEEEGSSEEMGWYGLIRGPIDVDLIDDHNEIVLDPELAREKGYREYQIKAAEVYDLMRADGFIVEQHSSGAVYSETFFSEESLEAAWQAIRDKYTVERCEECEAEAEEYGKGNPITHEDDCSEHEMNQPGIFEGVA